MQPSATSHLFCFGCGYAATVLARRLIADGWRVSGTARTAPGRAGLTANGIHAYPFDGSAPVAELSGLEPPVSHVLVSVPPDADGDPVLRQHRDLDQSLTALRWIGYLSTTGVYGDTGGRQVDERDAPRPTQDRSVRRLAAERAWLAFEPSDALPAHVFRLAGIYGPGRNVLETLKAGRARRIVKPGLAFARVHVDDIATVLIASMAWRRPGAIYNVCDDLAAPADEVVGYGAGLLRRAPPREEPYAQADLSPMLQSFYADNRRVSNALIKRELGVRLRYPSYREGLSALVSSPTAASNRAISAGRDNR